MKQLILFDLDNCLSAARAVGAALYQPAFDAMRRANHGRLDERTLEQAIDACWTHPLDWVADHYRFPEDVRRAGFDAFATIEVTGPMAGYDDLFVLAQLPVERHLVTSGFRRLQLSKVRALGIGALFAGVHVDAVDDANRPGKQGSFEQILQARALTPQQALVVGDNPESEIAAGNRLGIVTVQILRPGVIKSAAAKHHIASLTELPALLSG